MNNPYLELMQQDEREPLPPPKRPQNPYQQMMEREDLRRKSVVFQGAQTNPDTFAEATRLAQRYRIPGEVALEAIDHYRQKAKIDDALAGSMLTPTLSNAMLDPGFASMAHDDTSQLAMAEEVTNALRRGAKGLSQAGSAISAVATNKRVRDLDQVEQMLAEGQDPSRIPSELDPLGYRFLSPAGRKIARDRLLGYTAGSAQNIAQMQRERAEIPMSESIGRALQAGDSDEFWGAFFEDPVRFIAVVGSESLPMAAPGLVLGAATGGVGGVSGFAGGVAMGSFLVEYGASLSEQLRKKGVDITDAEAIKKAVADDEFMREVNRKAATRAAVVGAVDAIAGRVAAVPLTKSRLGNVALQMPLQGALGATGEGLASAAIGDQAGFGELAAEFFGEFATAPIDVALATYSSQVDRKQADREKAVAQAERIKELAAAAMNSKLKERSPEKFSEFLKQAAAESGDDIENIYVDSQALAEALAQSEIDPATIPGVEEQIDEAVALGSPVRVSVGDFAAYIAGTDMEASLMQHVKVDPDGLTVAEATLDADEAMAAFESEVGDALRTREGDIKFENDAIEVGNLVREQLKTANRFTGETNDAYTQLTQDFYAAMAARLGISPKQLYNQFPLRVASQIEDGGRFEQGDAIDNDTALSMLAQELDERPVPDNYMSVVPSERGAARQVVEPDLDRSEVIQALKPFVEREGLLVPSGADQFAMISPDLDTPGAWRVTTLDSSMQPTTHYTVPSVEEAIGEAVVITSQGQAKERLDAGDGFGFEPDGSGSFMQSRKSDVGHKREKTSGRYVGAPEWVGSSPAKLAKLRKNLRQLAIEGEPGRMWYEQSSRAILDLVGGDRVEAEKIVALIAIYSPNATVAANTTMALTAYYQFKAGLPIKAGLGANNKKATELLVEGKEWSGIKTNSFYQNLMVEIDPSKLDEGVATMDMWMALAFDYGMKVLDQGPKYKFAERETQRLAAELGWSAHQVQAAIWTAIKGRIDPIKSELKKRELKLGIGEIVEKNGKEVYEVKKDRRRDHYHLAFKMGMAYDLKQEDIIASKFDFSHAIASSGVQLSWEATPSKTKGDIPGIHAATYEQKAEYLQAVMAALTENGRDLIADMAGMPQGATIGGFSAWEGDVGAGAQTFLAAPAEGVSTKRSVKAPARSVLNLYSALKGLILGQDAVVWHQPVYTSAKASMNGVDVQFKRPLTEDEFSTLYQLLHDKFGTWELAPGFTPQGARVLNFVEGLDNQAYQKGFKEILDALPDDFGGGVDDAKAYRSDGEYISNDWEQNPDGKEYQDSISAAGRSDLLVGAAELRARVEAVNREFETRYGWGSNLENSFKQSARSDAAGGGRDRSVRPEILRQGSAQERQRARSGQQLTYGEPRDGAKSVTGYHFSKAKRDTLSSNFYGTGLAGDEANRLEGADPRLSQRVYFYIDKGTGIFAEEGVGGEAHRVQLDNLYDVDEDKLRIKRDTPGDFNDFELAIMDAGFDGYYTREFGQSGAAVLLGQHEVPVEHLGRMPRGTKTPTPVPPPAPRELTAPEQIGANNSLPIGKLSPQRWAQIIEKMMPEVYAELQMHPAWRGEDPLYKDQLGKALAKDPSTFDQTGGDRGAFTPSQNLITLLPGADLSTFLHESGHFYLHMLGELAAQPDAPQDIRDDMQTLLDFMGVENLTAWRLMSLDEQRDGHEKFARAFEAYLFEGKTPSPGLRGLFNKFSAWLRRVYQSIKALDVELTDEVRGVMDRMLASQEDIETAQTQRMMANDPSLQALYRAGMTADEWREYQNLAKESTDQAISELQGRRLRDMKWLRNARSKILKDLQAEAKTKRTEIRAEVTAEIETERVHAARKFFRTGEIMRDGELIQVQQGHKMEIDSLKTMYPESGLDNPDWRSLGYGRNGMLAKDGIDPEVFAPMLGYRNADEMIRDLLDSPSTESEIEARTDALMFERNADLVDERAVNDAVDRALANKVKGRLISGELRALNRANNPRERTGPRTTVNALARWAQDYARELIGRRRVADLRPAEFTRAGNKAEQESERALKRGDTTAAAVHKRNQLVHHHAVRAIGDAKQEVQKGLRYLRKFSREGTRKNITPDQLAQIDGLLEQFDIRQRTNKQIQRAQSLREWYDEQVEQGIVPNISRKLLNDSRKMHYSQMSYDDFVGLLDAIKNIEHVGRLKKRLLTDQDQREFDSIRDDIVMTINSNAKKKINVPLEANRWRDRAASSVKEFFAMHRKLSSYIRQMDGFEDNGFFWRYFVRPMNAAGDKEATMRQEASEKLAEILKPMLKKGGLRKRKFIPEIGQSISYEGRMVIALNWGNEGNRQRVMDGDKWNEQQVMAILNTLENDDWNVVEAVWEFIDSYWPEIEAKTIRLGGLPEEKVQAEPFTIKGRRLRGGYFPLKYDARRSTKAEADTAAEAAKAMLQGSYTRATTKRGHLEARLDKVNRPVRKELGVLFEHVDQVIHDLSWHEWLIDANRLLKDNEIEDAIRSGYGPEVLKVMKDTLIDIAAGEQPAQGAWERSLNHLRTGATVAGLGWNLTTALLQPYGLTQSMVRIGPKWVAKGLTRWIGDAARMQSSMTWITQKSPMMDNRARTMLREINEIQNRVNSASGAPAAIQASFFYLIQKLQLIADVPTWIGAYEKAMSTNPDEALAIALADQAVIDAQTSGQVKDLAAIQRGSPALKLFTNFYSFFSATYNLTVEATARANKRDPLALGRLAVDYLLLLTVPAVLADFMKQAISGELFDMDDDELLEAAARSQLNYLLGTMVGVRELGSAVSGFAGYSGPAGARFFSETAKLIGQTEQGELDAAALKALNNVGGILFHYPSGQVQRTVTGIEALTSGETSNPAAILLGPPK